jgi:phage shock protein B
MEALSIIVLLFVAPVIALAVICGTILVAIRIIKGHRIPGDQRQEANEAKMIQEIYQGLSRMEERLEALETILLDRAKGDQKNEKI